MKDLDFLKRVPVNDAVDEKKAFACAHVLFAHRTVFLLSSRVENVQQSHLIVDQALLAVGIFNRGVIFLLSDRKERVEENGKSINMEKRPEWKAEGKGQRLKRIHSPQSAPGSAE